MSERASERAAGRLHCIMILGFSFFPPASVGWLAGHSGGWRFDGAFTRRNFTLEEFWTLRASMIPPYPSGMQKIPGAEERKGEHAYLRSYEHTKVDFFFRVQEGKRMCDIYTHQFAAYRAWHRAGKTERTTAAGDLRWHITWNIDRKGWIYQARRVCSAEGANKAITSHYTTCYTTRYTPCDSVLCTHRPNSICILSPRVIRVSMTFFRHGLPRCDEQDE